jgi:glycosyltransferase involved in cell wall biosynthesis
MSSAAAFDVTIVILAFNEEAALASTVDDVAATVARLGWNAEILIIDDGSRDRTPEIADDLAMTVAGVRAIHHPVNQGLGEVYATAFREAGGNWLFFVPGDNEFPPAILELFAPHMAESDLILGYLEAGIRTPASRLLSWGERLLYRLLFGPMPKFQGMFGFRRALVEALPLVTLGGRGWGVIMEIIVRTPRHGFRTTSVLTPGRRRQGDVSRVNSLSSVLANLRQVLRLWQAMRRGRR